MGSHAKNATLRMKINAEGRWQVLGHNREPRVVCRREKMGTA